MGVSEYQIGILGGGQLARMSAMAGQRMGISVCTLDSDPMSPAAQVAPFLVGSISSASDIAGLMQRCDFVTLENEFILASTIREACQLAGFDEKKVIPGIDTISTIQDKLTQREAYRIAGVASPLAKCAEDAANFPCVLKARFGGYDGKGTIICHNRQEYELYRPSWTSSPWLAEEFIDFKRELAVMVVSTPSGKVATFPTIVTEQKHRVCDLVYPCFEPEICEKATKIAIDAVKSVKGVGLYGVEMFETLEGEILVNEIAPRPHNSGHYTLDWGSMSQFEAHLLCVLDTISYIPNGEPTIMANILGNGARNGHQDAMLKTLTQYSEARFHWYGKKEAKIGRKMGHINMRLQGQDMMQIKATRALFLEEWK
jgi:phosphoribosylaminoimidazole carboxylase PurK protein